MKTAAHMDREIRRAMENNKGTAEQSRAEQHEWEKKFSKRQGNCEVKNSKQQTSNDHKTIPFELSAERHKITNAAA